MTSVLSLLKQSWMRNKTFHLVFVKSFLQGSGVLYWDFIASLDFGA